MNCKHRPKELAWIVVLKMLNCSPYTCAKCGRKIVYRKQRYIFTLIGMLLAILAAYIAAGGFGYRFPWWLFCFNYLIARPVTTKYFDEYELDPYE